MTKQEAKEMFLNSIHELGAIESMFDTIWHIADKYSENLAKVGELTLAVKEAYDEFDGGDE